MASNKLYQLDIFLVLLIKISYLFGCFWGLFVFFLFFKFFSSMKKNFFFFNLLVIMLMN